MAIALLTPQLRTTFVFVDCRQVKTVSTVILVVVLPGAGHTYIHTSHSQPPRTHNHPITFLLKWIQFRGLHIFGVYFQTNGFRVEWVRAYASGVWWLEAPKSVYTLKNWTTHHDRILNRSLSRAVTWRAKSVFCRRIVKNTIRLLCWYHRICGADLISDLPVSFALS